jgi:hypothetical protein
MRNRSPLVRGCAIIIPLAHFLIFLSLFFPVQFPLQNPGEPPCIGWQWFFPCHPLPSDQDFYLSHIMNYVVIALIALIVLALPPLASVALFRSRWKMIGLLGLWISLPLTLGACLIFVEIARSAFTVHLTASPATWLPPPGFALSFLACLILALRLPLIRARERASVPVSRSVHLEPGQHERAERVSHPSGVRLSAPSSRWGLRLLFAFIGLLCHLVIGLSLFFTYTELYNPYEATTTLTTGWQFLDELLHAGPLSAVLAILLLAALVLPAPIYLIYLLPFCWKSARTRTRLCSSVSLNRAMNIVGLSVSGVLLMLSLIFRGGDLHDPVQSTDLAFFVPPAAFLFSLLCSTVLRGYDVRWHKGRELHF